MLARRVRREGRLSGRPYMWLVVLMAKRDVVESDEVNGVSQTRQEVWGVIGLQGTSLIGRLGTSHRGPVCTSRCLYKYDCNMMSYITATSNPRVSQTI